MGEYIICEAEKVNAFPKEVYQKPHFLERNRVRLVHLSMLLLYGGLHDLLSSMRADGPRRAQGRCEHSGTLWAGNKALRT